MSSLSKKNLFFVLFNLLFLLSFLLAETYLGLYVLGIFSLVLLSFGHTFPSKKTISLPIVVLILLLLGFFGFSVVTSISFPLSFYSFIRYVFLFSFFLFFLKTDFSQKEKKTFLQLLIFQGLSLVFISAIFFLLPEYGTKIPGMNVIFSTYGHNHLGAIMLILAPIAFWFYLTEKKKQYLIAFLLFAVSIALSFGRVVILVGLVQLAALTLYSIHWKQIKLKSFSIVLLLLMGILLVSSFLFFLYLGQRNSCLVEDASYRDQACKTDLRQNVRYFYWRQGWEALLRRPLSGYGIGTFESASYIYRQIPEFRSGYVHNDYLQIFAEGGILAGFFFIALLGFLYREAWENLKHTRQMVLFFGVAALGIDIFFDFDLHFLGVALLFFFLFALIVKSPAKTQKTIAVGQIAPLLTTLLVIALFTSGVYVVVDRLIAADKENTAFEIFPFFHWHSLNFIKSSKLTMKQKTYLSKVYWASPSVQTYWLETLQGEQKAQAEYQSWQADPWRRITSFLPQYYFEQKDSQNLEKILLDIKDFLDQKKMRYGFQRESILHSYKTQWAEQFIFLAEQKSAEKKYAPAGEFLQNAFYFNEWSFTQKDSLFPQLIQSNYEPAMKDLLTPLAHISAQYFGDSRGRLARLYFDQTLFLLRKGGDDELMQQSAEQVLKLAEWNAGWFREEIFSDNQLWSNLAAQSAWESFHRHALIFQVLRAHQFETDGYYSYGYYQSLAQQFLKPLQKYIDAQLELGSEEKAGQLLDAITQNSADLYWLQAQRGYFYGLIGENEKAKKAFEECLSKSPAHEDCQHGLGNLTQKGFPDVERYWEIREILLGE